ncbi:MAG TPA: hypothetical protein VK927_03380, partial [Adhaeribacter sp.]|nr:hypothetical protein [Adhaeribacter sp.]
PVFSDNHSLGNFLAPLFTASQQVNPDAFGHHMDHATEYMLMGISVVVALIAAIIAYVMYVSKKSVPAPEGTETGIHKLVYNKYYIDELYDAIIVRPVMAMSTGLYRFVENGIIDPVVNGVGRLATGSGRALRVLQNGAIGSYLLLMVMGIILILALNFFMR